MSTGVLRHGDSHQGAIGQKTKLWPGQNAFVEGVHRVKIRGLFTQAAQQKSVTVRLLHWSDWIETAENLQSSRFHWCLMWTLTYDLRSNVMVVVDRQTERQTVFHLWSGIAAAVEPAAALGWEFICAEPVDAMIPLVHTARLLKQWKVRFQNNRNRRYRSEEFESSFNNSFSTRLKTH